MEDGQVVEKRDTRLPLLLSPVSLMSQWSDSEELVEPVRQRKKIQTRIILKQQPSHFQVEAHPGSIFCCSSTPDY